jgi:hypothetical protein
MASRLSTIRAAIEVHVATAFSSPAITITNEPIQLGSLDKSAFPHAMILFAEEEPERLEFKQERRRVVGSIEIAVLTTAGDTAEATREMVDLNMEALRDAIFADPDLSSTVDDVSCDAAVTFSGTEDTFVYGTIDIRAEEVY